MDLKYNFSIIIVNILGIGASLLVFEALSSIRDIGIINQGRAVTFKSLLASKEGVSVWIQFYEILKINQYHY